MFSDVEVDLRDLIMENLESCGFLNKIKAELRAGVILACEKGDLGKEIPLFNRQFDELLETQNGKLMVSIIKEFLEYFNLNCTLKVFEPETSPNFSCFNRADLCNKLNLGVTDFDGPVLSAVLKTLNKDSSKHIQSKVIESMPHSIVSKSLETIVEDLPLLEKYDDDNDAPSKSATNSTFLASNSEKSEKKKKSLSEKNPSTKKSNTSEFNVKSNKLLNDFADQTVFPDKEDSNVNSIFKSSTTISDDNFFDAPLPNEKKSFFSLSLDQPINHKEMTEKPNSSSNSLSSLKDLPSFAETTDWTFNRDPVKQLPSLNSELPLKKSKVTKKESVKDIELAEDVSEKQNSAEESIEEEIDEEFSDGIDNLLNNSLSLEDDATSDHTVSQTSVVDGVDYIESLN